MSTGKENTTRMGLSNLARRCAALVAVAIVLPLTSSMTATAGASDPVKAAEDQVAALQAEVERTAAVLTAGSKKLEEGQAELARVQAELARTQREADEALARAEEAQRKLDVVISAAYRSPMPDGLAMAMTTGPDRFRDAMVARADLARVRGNQQDLLREATAERVEAEELVIKVDQLEDAAAAQERELAAQVEKLRALAAESERRLTEANARLEQARADRARAEADAAAQAARDRALMGGPAATCDGRPVGSQANGFLDPSTLCPLSYAPGHKLSAPAAAAFNRLTEHAKATTGSPLCVGDSYRPYGEQVAVYRAKPGLAAVPGTSNHGWGLALDMSCGVERFGSVPHEWMKANAPQFGWVNPDWARQGGSKPEAWHWEYVG
jgi:D-alanyl-D-alanine carboxypeptidase